MLHPYPSFQEIEQAHVRIRPFVHRTPILTSQSISAIAGADLHFKCENFQKVGAFKFRGASNAVLSLSEEKLQNGLCTHSSGNHAAALALAAKNSGAKSYIVMPENAPEIKKKAVAGYGAEIIFCKPSLDAREEALHEVLKKTGASFIHPYNNRDVIAGQGTAAKEMFEDSGDYDFLLCPVGGGGLLSGTAIAAKTMSKKCKVIAAEPQNADDAFRSFYSRSFFPSMQPTTIADGLLTSLGDLTFAVMLDFVDAVYTVSEEEIIAAMRMTWERMKLVIEPSSAVPLAVVLKYRELFTGKKVGIVISGGNVDLGKLPFV